MADLFDSLFDINRPALNAYVTQGQAQAGLRTAQTDEALANAQHAIDENNANAQLNDNLTSFFTAQGDPQAKQKAAVLSSEMIGNHGTAEQANAGLIDAQKSGLINVYMNPATDPQTRQLAGNIIMGKTQEPYQVVGNQLIPMNQAPPAPGSGQQPTVYQTPQSTAQETSTLATGALHAAQAAVGGFNPNSGGGYNQNIPPDAQQVIAEGIRANPDLARNIRSLTSYGGWRVAYNLFAGHPYPDEGAPGAAPPRAAPPGAAPPGAAPPTQLVPGVGAGAPLAEPGVSLHDQAQIRNYFDGPQGGGRVIALGTMADHANLFDALADQIQNGNNVPTNYLKNQWAKYFGGSAIPSNLELAAQFLGREAVRATINSGSGTGEERELQIGPNANPAALHGAAATLRLLARGQYNNLAAQGKRGGVDISQILDPAVRDVFTGVQGGPPVNLLKPGIVTRFGNGTSWTLGPNGQPQQVQ